MKQFLFLIFFFIHTISWAHNGLLKGRVIDETTQQPIIGAWVQLIENQAQTTTDAFGNFAFKELEAGKVTVVVNFLGYEKFTQVVEIKDNETTDIVLQMRKGSLLLEEVTVTSSDRQNLNAINAVDIKLRTVNSAQDLLRVVPGLFIAQHAGGGKAEQIFLRGFDIDHGTDINLQVDGMPVNMVSHAHGQGYADLHFVIPELIQNVAFEKGTYYADKGNFATAGYVDFQTLNVLDKSMLKIEGGQFGTLRTVATLDLLGKTAKKAGQSAYIAGEFLNSRGYFDSPQAFKRLNLWAKYQHQLDNNSQLTLSLGNFSSSWDASGQIPDRAVQNGLIGRFGAIDNTEGGQTTRRSFNAQLKQLLPKGGLLTNQIYAIQYDFELYSNFTFFLNNPLYGDQIRQKEARSIVGYQSNYTKDKKVGKMLWTSNIGAGLRYDHIQNNELSRTFGRKQTLEALALGDVQELNAHTYWSENIQFSEKLALNVATRFDYFQFEYVNKLDTIYQRASQHKNIVSPKLQLTYDPTSYLRLYAKVGYGFHSNDTRVVVAQQGREILPKALGFDIGTVFKPIPQLLLQVAFWNLNLEQEFVYVGDEAIVEPSGKTNRQGIDFSLRYQLNTWLFVDTDINFTAPKALDAPSDKNKIPLAPTVTSIGGLSAKLPNGLQGSIRYRYLADRSANEDYSLVAKGYFLLDATLQYNQPRYQVSVSIENALNQRWKEAQFETESRLKNELDSVTEIHYTPGIPLFLKVGISYFLF